MKTSEFIPKTKRKAKLAAVETPKSDIPKDLQAQWEAIGAVATAFACLNKGHFSFDYLAPVRGSLFFLQQMYSNCVTEALKHPQADMIPELKNAAKELEKQNGQTPSEQ